MCPETGRNDGGSSPLTSRPAGTAERQPLPSQVGVTLVLPRALIAAIHRGRVTALIRPARGQAECHYKRRRSYPLQARARGQHIGGVLVTATQLSLLHLVDDELARRAGWPNRDVLLGWWWENYREGPGREGNPEYPVEIPVWIVDIERDPSDHPRLLPGLPGEPEPVDEDTQAWISDDARERWRSELARRTAERAELPLHERLTAVAMEAERRRVDLSPEMRLVERALRTAERKLTAAA